MLAKTFLLGLFLVTKAHKSGEPKWFQLQNRIDGTLHEITDDVQECLDVLTEKDAFKIIHAGNGTCTQHYINQTAYNDLGVPAYSVEVKNVQDIQKAVRFANQNQLQVSVKSTGHSYSHSSMKDGSLMIWMANMDKVMELHSTFTPFNCDPNGKEYENILEFSGGISWGEIYEFLGADYNVIGGGCESVCASGGYIGGSGLSKMARKYGLGVDSVVQYELVTPRGRIVYVNAENRENLFWALRGGGGGSFGVVSKVWYQVFPKEDVHGFEVLVNPGLAASDPASYVQLVTSFNDFDIDISLNSSSNWSGYHFGFGMSINHVGNELDHEFFDKYDAWIQTVDPALAPHVLVIKNQTFPNYFTSVNNGSDVLFYQKPDVGQGEGFFIGNRLLTHDWLSNNRESARAMFHELLINGYETFSYWLGGAVSDMDHSSTAVNPVLRESILQLGINCFDVNCDMDKGLGIIDKYVPNASTGYNHMYINEADYRNKVWGEHLEKIQRIKRRYDVKNIFNCFNCVDY
eukprot:Awhi_evm1s9084